MSLLDEIKEKRLPRSYAEELGNNPQAFAEIIEIIKANERPYVQRAAFLFDYMLDLHPELLDRHWEDCFEILAGKNLHPATPRGILRQWQFKEIPDEHMGRVVDVSFRIIQDLDEEIAARVNAMTILTNICKAEPELKGELIAIIESHLPHAKAAFRSRAKRSLKQLRSL